MARLDNYTFANGFSFADVRAIYSKGLYYAGYQAPDGIPDRIWIEDDACHLYLDITDPETLLWKRTECELGFLPTTFGEYWFTFDFMYEWDFPNYVVIGEIANKIGEEYGVTYATLGYRVYNHCFLVQAQRNYSGLSFNNRVVASVPIKPRNWYSVCVHINLQPDTTGYLEIYLNKKLIAKEFNTQTAISTASAHYYKYGVYDGDHQESFAKAKMRLRNVTMWQGLSGYQEVLGGVPRIGQRFIEI